MSEGWRELTIDEGQTLYAELVEQFGPLNNTGRYCGALGPAGAKCGLPESHAGSRHACRGHIADRVPFVHCFWFGEL